MRRLSLWALAMRKRLSRSPLMRLAAVWAVTLALAAKILIAPGMMPVADAGGVRIILCTGAGPVETLLDIGGKKHGEPGKMAQEACSFASLGLGALAVADVEVQPPAFPPVSAPAALPPLPARAPPGARLPPPTGPPSLA